ncbi:MAG: hypothetical protein H7Z43_09645 [Clostridia bacterium]|nr:hypothetical protein [Deltaproteobacteria bacterium]
MKAFFALLVTTLSSAIAAAAPGEVIFGGGVAFGTEIATPGLQLNGYYAFDRTSKLANLRLGFDIDGFLSNTDELAEGRLTKSWADFNLNGQYVVLAPKDRPFLIYGLAGVNFAFLGAKVEYFDGVNQRDRNDDAFKGGLNLGVGGEYALDVGEKSGPDFSLFGEAKYVVSNADQLVVVAGIRFALPLGGAPGAKPQAPVAAKPAEANPVSR